ncbi:protein of unknown function UPF0153 [Anaeromyxobacter dehalogenans 2CP-1]|uniref:YkgJ family cysteine cluster protein n=1 Tax=Anaeromyxobacter dehalogenans (strain ATCC BAA-258 / DSM 21875 / 2CP-1) TaxID=455488 RepID=B8JFK2_ANAD2|nr:YkgJ family cysteine cluster protein [Anaeromyxobacter dehalogenans]ACL66379.1 protein of unknown function UPF0153 [Anaeromyxobacter dehalogenans 2CP-1]
MLDEAVARCRAEVEALAVRGLAGADEAALAAVLDGVERTVAASLEGARPSGTPPPACGPGCSSCCVLNVGTLAVEGAVAAARLRAGLEPGAAAALGARLLAFHDRVRWLEDRERIAARVACPLLDGAGRCAIHPARPLACRSVSAVDRGDCRAALALAAGEGDDDDGRAPVVRMDVAQRALYLEALDALAGALARRGLDARRRDVSGMVGHFLARPGALDAWLSGALVPLD